MYKYSIYWEHEFSICCFWWEGHKIHSFWNPFFILFYQFMTMFSLSQSCFLKNRLLFNLLNKLFKWIFIKFEFLKWSEIRSFFKKSNLLWKYSKVFLIFKFNFLFLKWPLQICVLGFLKKCPAHFYLSLRDQI